jgi:hypothetical protein
MDLAIWQDNFGATVQLRLFVLIDRDGNERAQGAALLRDGTANTYLVAEPQGASATCADADGDGTAGLTRLAVGLRDAQTGARSTAVISPLAGELDASGRYLGVIRVHNTTAPVVMGLVLHDTASGSATP